MWREGGEEGIEVEAMQLGLPGYKLVTNRGELVLDRHSVSRKKGVVERGPEELVGGGGRHDRVDPGPEHWVRRYDNHGEEAPLELDKLPSKRAAKKTGEKRIIM